MIRETTSYAVSAQLSPNSGMTVQRYVVTETFSNGLIKCNEDRSASIGLKVPVGANYLLCSNLGSLVIRQAGRPNVTVVPPGSTVFLFGGDYILYLSKGEHAMHFLNWSESLTPDVRTIVEYCQKSIFSKRVSNDIQSQIICLTETREENLNPISMAWIVSALLRIVAELASTTGSSDLVLVPKGLPDTLKPLVNLVILNPVKPWPLKEAAEHAGYSPFHFSRVFKSTVGVGFHEFVDRHRAAKAIQFLSVTDLSVEEIALRSGYGTTQGLRDSLREYINLSPSEIRSVPIILHENPISTN